MLHLKTYCVALQRSDFSRKNPFLGGSETLYGRATLLITAFLDGFCFFFWFKFKHTLSLPKHTLFSHTKSWFLVPISCPAGFCSFSCVSGGAVLHNPGHRFAVTVAAKLTVAILLAAAVPPPATRIAPNFARPAVDRRIRHHR